MKIAGPYAHAIEFSRQSPDERQDRSPRWHANRKFVCSAMTQIASMPMIKPQGSRAGCRLPERLRTADVPCRIFSPRSTLPLVSRHLRDLMAYRKDLVPLSHRPVVATAPVCHVSAPDGAGLHEAPVRNAADLGHP